MCDIQPPCKVWLQDIKNYLAPECHDVLEKEKVSAAVTEWWHLWKNLREMMNFWTSAILRLLTFPKLHILGSIWCDVISALVSTIHSHFMYCGIFHCVIHLCHVNICFNQIRQFDREKLHQLRGQLWAILSKQRFLKMQGEGSWDCFGLPPKYGLYNLLAIKVLDLMRIWWPVMLQHFSFNLGLHLNLNSSDKQHPGCWSLALLSSRFAVLGGSDSALPWRCQYLLKISCFGCLVLGGTKPSLESVTERSAPFLWALVSVVRGYLSWKFYNLCEGWNRGREILLPAMGKPWLVQQDLCAVLSKECILHSSPDTIYFFSCVRAFKTESYRFYRKEPEGKIWFLV